MPSKTKSSKSKSDKSSKKTKKSSSTKIKSSSSESKQAAVRTEPEVIEEVVEAVPETTDIQPVPDTEVKRRTRRVIDRESILRDFDAVLKAIDDEVQDLRSSDTKSRKTTGVKFLRSTSKTLRTLRSDAARVIKQRKPSTRPRNTTSGFMKPVSLSREMCKFTGWEKDCPKSRVDVTKFICKYIREKELQNPSDRRIILPDDKLKKLLSIDGSESDPLTYYSLQKKIQHHFNKDDK